MPLQRILYALVLSAATACGAAAGDERGTEELALARAATCSASPNPATAGSEFTISASGLQAKRTFNVDIFPDGSSTAGAAYYAWSDNKGNLVSWSEAHGEVEGVIAAMARSGGYTIRILELGHRLSDPSTWVASCDLQVN